MKKLADPPQNSELLLAPLPCKGFFSNLMRGWPKKLNESKDRNMDSKTRELS